MRRKPMSKSASRSNFSRSSKPHPKNSVLFGRRLRGGIRL